MSEQEPQNKPFVINDRRKFRMDGEPVQPAAGPAPESPVIATAPVVEAAEAPKPAPIPFPSRETAVPATNAAHGITPVPEPPADEPPELAESNRPDDGHPEGIPDDAALPPPPTAEEVQQIRLAYETTAERLDTMVRSQNLGAEHLPHMDFAQLVQSVYMSAMIQLGYGGQPGKQARVDILGAKQSIDMLNLIEEKTTGNLADQEKRILEAALFELRVGFLEITQLLAKQAAAKVAAPPPAGGPTSGGTGGFGGGGFTGGGPRIVR